MKLTVAPDDREEMRKCITGISVQVSEVCIQNESILCVNMIFMNRVVW